METRASKRKKLLLQEDKERGETNSSMETRASKRKRLIIIQEEKGHIEKNTAMETRASKRKKIKETNTAKKIRASKRKEVLFREEKAHIDKTEDRISDLPDVILHHILSFLSIKSIAQTSVLSTRWSYLWASYPYLDFSKVSPLVPKNRTTSNQPNKKVPIKKIHDNQTKAMEFLTTVLARRHQSSNIKVFRIKGHLSFSCLCDCIRRVVNHRIEELELDLSLSDRFYLPQCVFTCDSLKSLKLKANYPDPMPKNANPWFGFFGSNINGAAGRRGLRSLTALSLIRVHFMDTYLAGDLFSGSSFPILKKLTVEQCKGINNLNISCPNLEDLEVNVMGINSMDISCERLKNLQVKHSFYNCNNESWVKIFAPNLQTFFWEYNDLTEKCSVQSFPFLRRSHIGYRFPVNISVPKVNTAVSLLSGLSSAQDLYIGFRYIEILSNMYFAGGLPFSFINLGSLEIITGLTKRDIPGIVCLLRSSPLLHTLKIEIFRRTGSDKWNRTLLDNSGCTAVQYLESQAQALSSVLYHHLKVLKVHVVHENAIHERLINVIGFLLEHGKVLQEMTLSSKFRLWDQRNFGLVNEFPCASPSVKISNLD